jgi:altronate hydrolase
MKAEDDVPKTDPPTESAHRAISSSESSRIYVADPTHDNVGIVLSPLSTTDVVAMGSESLRVRSVIASGHKIALKDLPAGTEVLKYGSRIGFAIEPIGRGEHVHVHNIGLAAKEASENPRRPAPPRLWRTSVEPTRTHFLGYRRSNGRAATRNYIGILPTVNCSATVARTIAQRSMAALSPDDPIDGVIALNHDLGCGLAADGIGHQILRRTLKGYALHPNLCGVVVVGLGCEVNQPDSFLPDESVDIIHLEIQELGGANATVRAGLDSVRKLIETSAHLEREPIPISELILGLQCGGSDAYSGITANPTLGVAVDMLVAAGGAAILGETPEIYGAQHLLIERAADEGVGIRLDGLIEWWVRYAEANGATLDGNPSYGNIEGGISTIWEKSLGAVLKAGTSPLRTVVDYADPVLNSGLTFMDTPGYDPVSATGMVAGGANLLAFTTGRGSIFGSRPVPCLKITSTSDLYRRMNDDMDFDAGPAITPAKRQSLGIELFERLVDLASGARSRAEEFGVGSEEIAPWRLGAVL